MRKIIYEVVRRSKLLNYIAHKFMQSEWIRNVPFYMMVYNRLIAAKSARYLKAPSTIEFEVTNMCNARCIMCPPSVHLGKDFLCRDLFEKVAREAYELGVRRMILTGGEPLLDKDIFSKIEYAKKTGYLYVHMFTNGSLLDEHKAVMLVKSGLDSLTVSIDSAIKEEYEAIRRNLSYEKVVTNIQQFWDVKARLSSSTPLVRLNMVTVARNRNSRKELIRRFRMYADIIEIIDSHNFAGSLGVRAGVEASEYSQISRDPCHLLFSKATITPKGYLKKCSIDYSGDAIIGYAGLSFADVLYGERFCRIKRQHLGHDFCESGCSDCTQRESWWVEN